ncbi:MAG: efflux RND transporter periplasmic adaptor subunit [Xanthobacteraceae bacterium]
MATDSKLALLPAKPGDPPGARLKARQEHPEQRAEAPAPRPDAPQKQPEQPAETVATPEKAPDLLSRPWVRWVLYLVLPLVLIGGGYWYVTGGQVMSTDNAYINAETVGVSTDVSGIVKEIGVTDNQRVEAGQVLYRLDSRQFRIALDNATANLTQTALTIDSMKEDYRRMLSDADAQQGQVDLDQLTYNRDASLLPNGTTSKATYDQANSSLSVDKNKLKSLRQQAAVQLAKLAGNPDIPSTQHPQYLEAQAQVDEAQRQLDDTVVKAPFGGVVTGVPSIAPGKYLAASTTAFYLVDMDHLWGDATPKETELTYVRLGQSVTVKVDTYPNAEWHGVVESISPAAAQQFALLPAQNTSGNWVKVVQRIAMRVRIDTSDKNLPPLRAGMSLAIAVDTGHARGFPHFVTALFDRL